jgi:hypothetical protein
MSYYKILTLSLVKYNKNLWCKLINRVVKITVDYQEHKVKA